MRMLCGVLKPTSGTVTFQGQDVSTEEYRKNLGYLPQDFGYYPEFTGRDFLIYLSVLKGMDKRSACLLYTSVVLASLAWAGIICFERPVLLFFGAEEVTLSLAPVSYTHLGSVCGGINTDCRYFSGSRSISKDSGCFSDH